MQHNGDEHLKVEQSLVFAKDLACSVLFVKVNVVDAIARAHFCHQCDFFLQFLVVDITFSANSQESVLSEVSESREIHLFQSSQSPAGKNFEKVEPPLYSLFIVMYLLASEYVKRRYSFVLHFLLKNWIFPNYVFLKQNDLVDGREGTLVATSPHRGNSRFLKIVLEFLGFPT